MGDTKRQKHIKLSDGKLEVERVVIGGPVLHKNAHLYCHLTMPKYRLLLIFLHVMFL